MERYIVGLKGNNMPQPSIGPDLIALLSSLDPSERQKNRLFWRDDMEDYQTCKWVGNPGDICRYVNDVKAFEGDHVLSLNNLTSVQRIGWVKFGAIAKEVHAFEVRWWKEAALVNMWIQMVHSSHLVDEVLIGRIAFSAACWWTNTGPGGLLEKIKGGEETIRDSSWNYLKFWINFKTGKFYRLKTCALDLDLQPLNLSLATSVGWGLGQFYLYVGGEANGVNKPIYFDDARLYLNAEE